MAKHQMPARGALDGLKKDLRKAKEDPGAYNPNGVGNAYSHNFLNQKPWHPANFRNQARVYEAEQKKIEETKQRAVAKAEFEAEQEFLKTLSYLSPEEQQKFRERQGVQFLYMKPPGADSMPSTSAQAPAEQPKEEAAQQGATAASGGAAPDGSARPQRSHVGDMLGAVRALQNHDRWEVKHVAGVGRSPPRGTADSAAANQQIIVSSDEDNGAIEGVDPGSAGRRSRKQSSEQQLAEAEAILRRAGYDIDELRGSSAKKARQKKKKRKKEKKERRSKAYEEPAE